MAKTVQAPIFHVNGDDPEACVRVAQLAFEYRQTFHKDVVIDMVCYRRHGHNEGDDPSYTQPLMYKAIAERRSVRKLYVESLVKRGDITVDEAEQALADFQDKLQVALDETRAARAGDGQGAQAAEAASACCRTSRPVSSGRRSTRIFDHLTDYPEGFTPHPKLASQFESRGRSCTTRRRGRLGDRRGAGDRLAACSKGTPVRLAGEDTRRGTFSQRHAALIDYETGEPWIPLDDLDGAEAHVLGVRLAAVSEYAALGFEYGYAHSNHEALVMWEAQFGDFVNGAQIIIDQYIVAAEDKWGQHERPRAAAAARLRGPGPRAQLGAHRAVPHARAPRTTSRSCNATTAAQYFHLLRRQVHSRCAQRRWSCSRRSRAAAHEADPVADRRARRPARSRRCSTIRASPIADAVHADRVLLAARWPGMRWPSATSVGAPVADRPRRAALPVADRADARPCSSKYPNARELVWLQEEPENMGAVALHRAPARGGSRSGATTCAHVARVESGSPATGSKTDPRPGARRPHGPHLLVGEPVHHLAALRSSVVAQRQLRPPRLASWRTDLAEREDSSLAEVELRARIRGR